MKRHSNNKPPMLCLRDKDALKRLGNKKLDAGFARGECLSSLLQFSEIRVESIKFSLYRSAVFGSSLLI